MSSTPPPTSDLRHAIIRLAHRLRVERAPDGLSSNKLAILARLHRHGPATQRALADAERQQPQSLTRLLAELVQAGLVAKTPSAIDRREIILSITLPGRQALGRNMAARDAWLASALGNLTELEGAVVRLAIPLLDRLAEAAPAPPAPNGAPTDARTDAQMDAQTHAPQHATQGSTQGSTQGNTKDTKP